MVLITSYYKGEGSVFPVAKGVSYRVTVSVSDLCLSKASL